MNNNQKILQMETGEIYKRMALIMKEVKAISKSEKNQQQGFKFRGIDNVMNELHDVFAKNDVFVLQEVLDYTTTDRLTKSGGVNTFTRARIRFRYCTTDGSSIETVNVGEAMDSGDKGMNKAMSIALKYSLMQMLLIPTEESKDPDAVTPEETDYLEMALQEIECATSKEELTSVANRYGFLRTNARFRETGKKKMEELLK